MAVLALDDAIAGEIKYGRLTGLIEVHGLKGMPGLELNRDLGIWNLLCKARRINKDILKQVLQRVYFMNNKAI